MTKKIFILFAFLLLLTGCVPKEEPQKQTLQELINSITFAESITDNLTLPESYLLNGEEVFALWESSDPSVLSHTGEVNRTYYDQNVTLSLELVYGDQTIPKTFSFVVVGTGIEQHLNMILDILTIPLETSTDIFLRRSITHGGARWTINWTVSHEDIVSPEGNVALVNENIEVTLSASITYESITVKRDFLVVILAMSDSEKVDYVFNNVSIPTSTSQNLELPTAFMFGITGVWESSHPNVLSTDGIIASTLSGKVTVTLTLTLSTSDRRTFEIMVSQYGHLYLDRTFEGTKDNVVVVDGLLQLAPTATLGTYTTEVVETLGFSEVVGSWAATSSTNATAELLVRVRVDGVWSRYFSYGAFGLGLQNRMPSTSVTDPVARLSHDEIIVQNGKTADAIQMQMVLRRTQTSNESAKVTLLAAALNIPNYTYNVDISGIRTAVDYDVPKLYQHIVPSIGGIICSPTSSTMLLNYKGHDFSDKADYQHQYISAIVREYTSGIYGNWTYNTVGISAFGETSYVKRMYSYQELLHHLDTVGPVSVSVRGTLVGELVRTWTTNGHLIVVRGYRFDGDQLYILANDPNLSPVYEEYKIENFLAFWRNIAYIVE